MVFLISPLQISQTLAQTSDSENQSSNRSYFTVNEIPSNSTINPSETIHTSPNPTPPSITPTPPRPSNSSIDGAIKNNQSSLKNKNLTPATKSKKVGTPSTIRTWPPNNSSYQN